MLNEAFSYWQHLKNIKEKFKASVHVLQKVAGTGIQISAKAVGLSLRVFFTLFGVTVLMWRSQSLKYKILALLE